MTEIEFSHVVLIEELPVDGREITLEAKSEERAKVARRLGLMTLKGFAGNLVVRPEMGREISVEGEIRAEFEQECVVTGEPVPANLTFPLQRRYSETADNLKNDVEPDDEDFSEEDGPDPIINGKIDVGEAAVEELSLQIPVYPRAEGATFDDRHIGPVDDAERENPFAALEELKNRLKSDT